MTENTARLFMHKIREAMKSSETYPMDGMVEVDEFVVEGKETRKVGRCYNSKKKKIVLKWNIRMRANLNVRMQ